MHSRCGSIEEAQEVFVMMLERDMDGPLQHPNPGMLLDPGKSPVRDRVFFAKLSTLARAGKRNLYMPQLWWWGDAMSRFWGSGYKITGSELQIHADVAKAMAGDPVRGWV